MNKLLEFKSSVAHRILLPIYGFTVFEGMELVPPSGAIVAELSGGVVVLEDWTGWAVEASITRPVSLGTDSV